MAQDRRRNGRFDLSTERRGLGAEESDAAGRKKRYAILAKPEGRWRARWAEGLFACGRMED